MLQALSTRRNRAVTCILLAACCACAIAAVGVGIAGNPSWFWLALLAASACVLALSHPWRTAAPFRALFYASFLALAALILLGMVVDIYVSTWVLAQAPALRNLLVGLWSAVWVLVLSFFPPAFLIGLGGWIASSFRDHRRARGGHGTA